MDQLPHYDVLSFLYDNDNGCALTARMHGAFYHVTANASRLQDRSKSGKKTAREYRQLLAQVKEAEQGEDGQNNTAPLFVQEDENGEGEDESDEGKDSGVEVQTPEEEPQGHPTEPPQALERWMLSPLAKAFAANKSKSKKSQERSVEDWYLCPTHYFDLRVKDGKLVAEEDTDPSSALKQRIQSLIPSMPLHKYITDFDIPMLNAKDLLVLHESSEPADTPLHPCLVRNREDGVEYFLKTVDRGQLQPMNKRELQVMKRIESEGLHNEIRVPLLRGLVQFSSSTHSQQKQDIMGFLLDPIKKPKPLTHMLDTEIPEEKRLKWAEESARMVDILHQHSIIWGDAKGDNFMVDEDDELWIIDFGGSYTEGWVDEELKETEAGDEQGIQRLKNGLKDPEKMTTDGEGASENADADEEVENDVDEAEVDEADLEETKEARRHARESCEGWEERYEAEQKQAKSGGRKRKASDGVVGSRDSKMAKQDQSSEPRYCYCNEPESGKMLGCDGPNCSKQWFHFACVGINEAPSGKWYCKDCKGAT